jgi:lysophospholipase L1-like esterase
MPTPTTATRALCKPESGGIACHFGGDPGNYDVAFKLGGTAAGKTEVQAETKREMLAEVDTTAGQTELYSMKVNVREPQGQPDWSAASPGTPGLDLFFIGPSPQLDSIAYAPSVNPVVMYITGDSTVTDQDGPAIQAWGQRLPQYFGCGISVANYASSGGLTECNPCGTNYFSFYDDPKLWPAIKLLLKANDIVLIEFGHNDKQTQQTPFETYLKKYVDETRAVGAFPVLVTPIVRSSYTGTPHINSVGVNLPESIRAVATANNVPVIDLTARTQAYLIQRGNATGFYNDSAHTTLAGAQAYAELAADEIRTKNILPLRNYLRQP